MKSTFSKSIILLLVIFSCTPNQSDRNNQESISDPSDETQKTEFQFDDIVDKELDASDIYEISKNSIALVLSLDKNSIPLSIGTGFYIDSNRVVTNHHVINGAKRIKIKIIGEQDFITDVIVEKSSHEHDLAILKTKNHRYHLGIDSSNNESIGSKIYTIGNPRGLEGTISQGIISGYRKENYDVIQITAPISPGNSGGPVLNGNGHVIGVSTFTIANSQNLNFAIPIKYLSYCGSHYDVPSHQEKKAVVQGKKGVELVKFNKDNAEFKEQISLRNNTEEFITKVTGVLIYKDMNNVIIDYKIFDERIIIPPGLAKMVTQRSFDQEQRYHYYKTKTSFPQYMYERFKVDFRLLSYEIEE